MSTSNLLAGWSALLPEVLLHTLWQGAFLAYLVWMMLRVVPARKASLRYGIALLGLGLVVVGACATWRVLQPDHTATIPDASLPIVVSGHASRPDAASLPIAIQTPPVSARRVEEIAFPETKSLLFAGWLCGVSVMLLRLALLVRGTQRLRVSSLPLTDMASIVVAAELKDLMGMAGRATVRVSEEIAGPMAFGLVWPVILIPAMMATGMPPEYLRAVLAHEFAHVRRYDYLVNFVQLLIESFLFFNPAVWWLSRQIRLEREVCCDQWATLYGNGELTYGEALVFAFRMMDGRPEPLAHAAHLTPKAESGMMERLARLLRYDYLPPCRLHWRTLIIALLAAAAGLLAVQEGVSWSTEAAMKMLSDDERMAEIRNLMGKYPAENRWPRHHQGSVRISGMVTTWDGRIPPKHQSYLRAHTQNHNHYSYQQTPLDKGHFEFFTNPGKLTIQVYSPEYAPALVDSLLVNDGETEVKVSVHLEPGKSAAIRFVDDDGQPISNISVVGGYTAKDQDHNTWYNILNLVSDTSGRVVFAQNAEPLPVTLEAFAPGYATEQRRQLTIAGGEEYVWTMHAASPVEGYVRRAADNMPVQDAEIRLLSKIQNHFATSFDMEGKYLTKTDEQGRFDLSALQETATYTLAVRATGYGKEILDYTPNKDAAPVVLLQPRHVRGRIRGDLLRLLFQQDLQTPLLKAIILRYDIGYMLAFELEPELTYDSGELLFSLEDLPAGHLQLSVGSETFSLDLKDSVDDLQLTLLDHPHLPKRACRVCFTVPEGAVMPYIRVNIVESLDQTLKDQVRHEFGLSHTLEAHDGCVETMLGVPANISLIVEEIAGYIPAPSVPRDWHVAPAEEAYTLTVPLERAGAITGKLLDKKGLPVIYEEVRVSVAADSFELAWPRAYLINFTKENTRTDEQGGFLLSPLPLNKPITVSATINGTRCQKEIQLTAEAPVADIVIDET